MLSIATLLITVLTAAPALEERAVREADLNNVLGISVGSAASDVRGRLSPLGTVESRVTQDGGTKEVWRFKETGFAWIALKTSADGRVIWITGHRRPGDEIPFDELSRDRPSTDTGAIAIWYVSGKSGGVRVTARGQERRARVITYFAEKP